MRRTTIPLITTILLGLAAGLVGAQGVLSIDWFVIGGGSGHAEAAPYTLDGTVGQPVVGTVSQGNTTLCSGFWCGTAVEYKLYLPLVLRNA